MEWANDKNVKLEFRPSKNPRSVLVERYHRNIWEKLTSFVGRNPRQWPEKIQKVVNSLNSQPSDAHGFSPAYLNSGFKSSPIEGQLTANFYWFMDLLVARAVINDQKESRKNQYTFRTIPKETDIIVRYENFKNSPSLKAKVVEDKGSSTVLAKLEGRHLPLKIHKSHIYLEKSNKEYTNIFE